MRTPLLTRSLILCLVRRIARMPNGKGSLDCCYCVHFDAEGYPDGHGEERCCRFHESVLPKPQIEFNNRICGNFEASEAYFAHNRGRQFVTVARRFAWFGADLEPGVLYEFCCNEPPGITKSAVLRVPDYQNDTWTKPSA
jgi:hypothetical protein